MLQFSLFKNSDTIRIERNLPEHVAGVNIETKTMYQNVNIFSRLLNDLSIDGLTNQ